MLSTLEDVGVIIYYLLVIINCVTYAVKLLFVIY